MEPDLTDLTPLVELAELAGKAILEVYGSPGGVVEVTRKGDDSPLTEADRASHRVIADGLRKLTPMIPVVSEEGEEWGEGRSPGTVHWMVDPLDGTKEFLKRTGEFTVNIALIRDGRPFAGVVHAPVLARSWVGSREGAWLRTVEDERPLRVRPADPGRMGIVASRDHAGPAVTALLARTRGGETLSMGSSLKFCLIAEGRADLYLRDGPTMEWDTGAAQAVLEGAGGGVYTLDGVPLRYGKPGLRNPHFVAVGDPALKWKDLLSNHMGTE